MCWTWRRRIEAVPCISRLYRLVQGVVVSMARSILTQTQTLLIAPRRLLASCAVLHSPGRQMNGEPNGGQLGPLGLLKTHVTTEAPESEGTTGGHAGAGDGWRAGQGGVCSSSL